MNGYRYIQDVTFSVGEIPSLTRVGLKRAGVWYWRFDLSIPNGMTRWVAPPNKGVISTDAFPITLACEPPTDGVTVYVIFDIEPDRSLQPASWRDYSVEWGYWWDDPDDEIPWWRKKPHLVAYRRRVKPAKMFAEQSEWIDGKLVTQPGVPLDAA